METTTDIGPVAVLGAGSIGCFVGGCLQASGVPVRFFGRKHLAGQVAEKGLHLTSLDGIDIRLSPESIDFRTELLGLEACPVILVCVKSGDTAHAASGIAGFGAKGSCVISLQNGVGNAETLADTLDGFTVLPGTVSFNVARQDGTHFHKGTEGNVTIGDDPVSQDLVSRLSSIGLPAETSREMRSVLWGKLLFNLNNGLNVLSDKPLLQQLKDRYYRRVLAILISETLAVLDKAGIEPARIGKVSPRLSPWILRLPDWLFERVAAGMLKIDEKARSSMWDDLARGRSSEIDYLNGAVIALAGKVDAQAPANRKITELVKAAFEAGRSPQLDGRRLFRQVRDSL